MNRLHISIVALLLYSTLLLSCQSSPRKEKMPDHQDFLDKYSLLKDSDHVFVSKTAQQVLEAAQNEESFVLLLGFDSCPWCQTLLPVLNAQAKAQHIPEVWYWDPRPFRGDGKEIKHAEEYLQILELVGLEQPESASKRGITGVSRISVPFLAVINYGSIDTFEEAPIAIGAGTLMRDAQGQRLNTPTDSAALRYQDGFMLNREGQVLGAYMWDDLITGYQVPAEFSDHIEWLNRTEFTEALREQLRILLNISVCGLCSG